MVVVAVVYYHHHRQLRQQGMVVVVAVLVAVHPSAAVVLCAVGEAEFGGGVVPAGDGLEEGAGVRGPALLAPQDD